MLLPGRVVGLVADRLDTAVDAEPVGGVHDRLSSVGLGQVDGGGANLLRQGQPVGLEVDDERLGGPADVGAERGHRPTGPAPKIATVRPGSTPAISVPW